MRITRSLGGREVALFGLLLLTAAVFLLLPVSLEQKMWAIAYGICPQRASHSYFLARQQMPLEARMTGIFAGFLLTLTYFFLTGRSKASRLPPLSVLVALIGFVAIMGFDGLNATFYDFGLPYAYQPQNSLRLATGLMGGVAMAALTWPVLSLTFWRNPVPLPSFAGTRELIGCLLVPALVFVATVGQFAPSFYPISLISVFGVLAFLTLLNALFLLPLSYGEGKGQSWWDFLLPAGGGLALSGLELAVLSALKFAVMGSAPLP